MDIKYSPSPRRRGRRRLHPFESCAAIGSVVLLAASCQAESGIPDGWSEPDVHRLAEAFATSGGAINNDGWFVLWDRRGDRVAIGRSGVTPLYLDFPRPIGARIGDQDSEGQSVVEVATATGPRLHRVAVSAEGDASELGGRQLMIPEARSILAARSVNNVWKRASSRQHGTIRSVQVR